MLDPRILRYPAVQLVLILLASAAVMRACSDLVTTAPLPPPATPLGGTSTPTPTPEPPTPTPTPTPTPPTPSPSPTPAPTATATPTPCATCPQYGPVPASGVGPYYDTAPAFVRNAIAVWWPQSAWEHAAVTAYNESQFNPRAWNLLGEDSRGLWQIEVGTYNRDLLALGDLFDPMVNAQAASIVWRRQGWNAWSGWRAIWGPGVP